MAGPTAPSIGEIVQPADPHQGSPLGSEDGDYVACILVDHGKSLKLGLLTEDLVGVNSVAESVCITRKECLGPVTKQFKVEGACDRGYCAHNPNVTRLADDEIDKILSKQFSNL